MYQQQHLLNQFYLSNGYLNPYYYQIYQLMNQNLQNSNMFNMGINPELNLNDGNDQNMINQQQYQQGQDINQLFNNLIKIFLFFSLFNDTFNKILKIVMAENKTLKNEIIKLKKNHK